MQCLCEDGQTLLQPGLRDQQIGQHAIHAVARRYHQQAAFGADPRQRFDLGRIMELHYTEQAPAAYFTQQAGVTHLQLLQSAMPPCALLHPPYCCRAGSG